MNKTDQIQVRINPETKVAAEAIFSTLGLKPSEAVRMFYHQVALNRGIPFDIRIPNAETLAAMAETEENTTSPAYKSFADIRDELDV